MAISADSKYLAAANGDGEVTVWDLSQGQQVAFFDFDQKDFTMNGLERIVWVRGHEALIVPTRIASGDSPVLDLDGVENGFAAHGLRKSLIVERRLF